MEQDYSPLFLKLRAWGFFGTTVVSFAWVILLSVDVFLRWNQSEMSERSLLIVLLIVNVITMFMLPILILRRFRPYLDAARIALLLMGHIGSASAFTYWNTKITCAEPTADQEGVCMVINVYIIFASWVIPLILILYAVGLAVMVYLRRKRLAAEPTTADEESIAGAERQSHLPMMKPEMGQRSRSGSASTILWPGTLPLTPQLESGSSVPHNARRGSAPASPRTIRRGSAPESPRTWRRGSAPLSPRPEVLEKASRSSSQESLLPDRGQRTVSFEQGRPPAVRRHTSSSLVPDRDQRSASADQGHPVATRRDTASSGFILERGQRMVSPVDQGRPAAARRDTANSTVSRPLPPWY